MKKTLCRVSALLLALLLWVSMVPVYAASQTPASVNLPVKLTVTGSAPSSKELDYTFRLTAITEGAPMPEDALQDEETGAWYKDETLTIKGKGEETLSWPLTFTRVGEYHYKVEQIRGTHKRCSYDKTVYYVKITVVNSVDGDSLVPYVVAYKDESMQGDDKLKEDELVFTNRFKSSGGGGSTDPEPKPEQPDKIRLEVDKVWAGSGKNRPDSVTIQLLDGNTVVDTVTLADWNNWHYTWADLDGEGSHDWNVKELDVPAGYTVSYSFSGSTFTVRNTETLIQTGQLNWPVPVMGGLGLALVALGFVMLRKKKESGNA